MTNAKFTWTNKALVGMSAQKACQFVALEVLRDTKLRCPVDTGTLRRSYTSRSAGTDGYIVGTNVFYAPFVEFGTRYNRAQPHLGPALEMARQKYGRR